MEWATALLSDRYRLSLGFKLGLSIPEYIFFEEGVEEFKRTNGSIVDIRDTVAVLGNGIPVRYIFYVDAGKVKQTYVSLEYNYLHENMMGNKRIMSLFSMFVPNTKTPKFVVQYARMIEREAPFFYGYASITVLISDTVKFFDLSLGIEKQYAKCIMLLHNISDVEYVNMLETGEYIKALNTGFASGLRLSGDTMTVEKNSDVMIGSDGMIYDYDMNLNHSWDKIYSRAKLMINNGVIYNQYGKKIIKNAMVIYNNSKHILSKNRKEKKRKEKRDVLTKLDEPNS